jgi:hypothetical protein
MITGAKLETRERFHLALAAFLSSFSHLSLFYPSLEAPGIEQRQQFFVTGPRQRRKL